MDSLIVEIKQVMLNSESDIQVDLKNIMRKYGIDFSMVKNFRGAPVQGYLSQKNDGTYQMAITSRDSYADIFWFSLFHEIGHLVNGDVGKSVKFLDDGSDDAKERNADIFASNKLINQRDYEIFITDKNFTIEYIKKFAASQNVMPYVVIDRLQKEKYLRYDQYSGYRLKYKKEWLSIISSGIG